VELWDELELEAELLDALLMLPDELDTEPALLEALETEPLLDELPEAPPPPHAVSNSEANIIAKEKRFFIIWLLYENTQESGHNDSRS
jgi:hypothetical protein